CRMACGYIFLCREGALVVSSDSLDDILSWRDTGRVASLCLTDHHKGQASFAVFHLHKCSSDWSAGFVLHNSLQHTQVVCSSNGTCASCNQCKHGDDRPIYVFRHERFSFTGLIFFGGVLLISCTSNLCGPQAILETRQFSAEFHEMRNAV